MKYGIAMVFAVFILTSQQAMATVYGSMVRTTPYTSSSTTFVTVPLNDSGTTTKWIYSATPKQIIIAYNAECSIAGAGKGTWVDLDILVGGVAVSPTNGDKAFCTSHEGISLASWNSVVSNVQVTVPAGWTSIQVRARRAGAGGSF